MIFLIWVFHVVVSLQGPSDVTGVVAVGTAKWLHRQKQTEVNANEIYVGQDCIWTIMTDNSKCELQLSNFINEYPEQCAVSLNHA